MSELQLDQIRHALTVARQLGCTEVELEAGDLEFSARLSAKRANPAVTSPDPARDVMTSPESPFREITAPCVGYYQDGKTPLKAGDEIKVGDLVGVVSALGLGNDVESSFSGTIEEVLVKDGDPVEYGQALARVRS
ncbi:MAG: biotin/lipoyl-binding protein [Fimbriimonadaceae bacterium]|nr:biotin/lipoyl-binding protein [Fimbriimonadaceae bacterium]